MHFEHFYDSPKEFELQFLCHHIALVFLQFDTHAFFSICFSIFCQYLEEYD